MMRSYEDRWNWLRAQLEDDAAVLRATERDRREQGLNGAVVIAGARAQAIEHALRHMDDADRNGPVEPL